MIKLIEYNNMNYELAKELKDGGFPLHSNENISVFNVDDVIYATPTLSELIEACGEDFSYMDGKFRLQKCNECKDWIAHGFSKKDELIVGEGKTPEEAVARLWLKLNTPQNK